MAYMTVMLVVLLGVAVWLYFHTNPPGVPTRPLAICNALVFLVAVPAGIAVGSVLYAGAVAAKGDQTALPIYLSIMAGGTVFLIAMMLGGMVRSFFVFPPEKRAGSGQVPPYRTPYG
ncbi:MAG: hypothetical protein IPF73_11660 [Betaproteobacteria bacterium]|nr:hypothetical protein [Betaproteobacteria bacterium]